MHHCNNHQLTDLQGILEEKAVTSLQMWLSQTPRIQITRWKLTWTQEHYPCDIGCMTTGHLILASLLPWLLHKIPGKPQKHTVVRQYNSLPPLSQPTLALMTRVLSCSSNAVTSGMFDHNNLKSSWYLMYLKRAFSLMTAIDHFFAFRKEIWISKQGHVPYCSTSIRCKYSNCEKEQKSNPC